jgi:hypothetical protein
MVLILGLLIMDFGSSARQVGHCFLPWLAHFRKHFKQKLCWQGAVTGLSQSPRHTPHLR